MVKIYLVILVVVVLLLAIPSTRRLVLSPRDLLQRRGEAADTMHRAADAVRSAGGSARSAGDAVVSSRVTTQLEKLARTLVIQAPVDRLAPLLGRAMEATAVLDPVPPSPGEGLAWVYSSLADTRIAATSDEAGNTVFGVVSFEYSMRMPQGGSAVDLAIDKASEALTEQGIAFHVVSRTFEPGATITADGPRTALPLSQ
jgi:hypothetical protein